MNDKMTIKPLARAEAEILRAAGVTWLDDMTVIYKDNTYCHRLGCATAGTTATGGTAGTNNTYSERELARRLEHGWTSTGDCCGGCDMPVIHRTTGGGGLLQCVICASLHPRE